MEHTYEHLKEDVERKKSNQLLVRTSGDVATESENSNPTLPVTEIPP